MLNIIAIMFIILGLAVIGGGLTAILYLSWRVDSAEVPTDE